MESSKFKNMVVLKNLPSNIVEEAIVVLKSNKKVKKLEKIEKNKSAENKIYRYKEDNYILKEAEMLISSYISRLENTNNKEIKITKTNKKYVRLKKYAYISSIIIFIQAIALLIQ